MRRPATTPAKLSIPDRDVRRVRPRPNAAIQTSRLLPSKRTTAARSPPGDSEGRPSRWIGGSPPTSAALPNRFEPCQLDRGMGRAPVDQRIGRGGIPTGGVGAAYPLRDGRRLACQPQPAGVKRLGSQSRAVEDQQRSVDQFGDGANVAAKGDPTRRLAAWTSGFASSEPT